MTRLCFVAAVLASASILFLIQPVTAKILLPLLGGSPAVWNTCMVFFQALLLAGYCYADMLTCRLPLLGQVAVHAVVLATGAIFLPMATNVGTPEDGPVWWLLKTLFTTVGLPFFALCATAPLVQRWFSATRDRAAADPYFLYAASNGGSLFALLAYPLLLEPLLSRGQQSLLVAGGYVAAAVTVIACGVLATLQADRSTAARHTPAVPGKHPLGWPLRGHLVVLAAIPSSLVMGATHHLTSDVAALPMLWVMPLAIYLSTFMLAFSRWPPLSATDWGTILPIAAIPAAFFIVSAAHHPLAGIVFAHVTLVFVAGMMCHRRLFELRPGAERLTEYYLFVSLGGVLGGVLNAFVAPLLFNDIVEYPLAIAACFWLRPQIWHEAAGSRPLRNTISFAIASATLAAVLMFASDAALAAEFVTPRTVGNAAEALKPFVRSVPPLATVVFLILSRRPLAAAAAVAAVMACLPFTGQGGDTLHQERSFFGIHRVVLQPTGNWVVLNHGTTVHGVQALRHNASEALSALSFQPTTYYCRSGPLGDIVRVLESEGRLDSVGVIGLGAGTLAAYASPGMTMHFFEIDPTVCRIAADPRYFTYLADAAAKKSITLFGYVGDGRLRLAEQPAGSYDLIVVDAFASDSIPMHLITREAVATYADRLKPGGLIAFNISNRYFNLAPPLAAIAASLKLSAAVRHDLVIPENEVAMGKHGSIWVAVGTQPRIETLRRARPDWHPIPLPDNHGVWTDDYGNLLGAFNGW